jgi:hypothetical protein
MKRRELLLIHDAIARAGGNGAATGFTRAASTVFGWAVDHDWIEHTPVHRIKNPPSGRLRAWTRTEADAAAAGFRNNDVAWWSWRATQVSGGPICAP